ncbi:MAG: hypothetical protein PVH12_07070, partial [Candidatus Bathyarchaeota archaeon]
MRKIVKVIFALMVILTATFVSVVMYTHASYNHVMYAAIEYESAIPPTDWYTPGQLGIVNIIEREGRWLHTVVDKEKEPFPLQRINPIFLYKEEFYQVSSLWATPSLPRHTIGWQVP